MGFQTFLILDFKTGKVSAQIHTVQVGYRIEIITRIFQ